MPTNGGADSSVTRTPLVLWSTHEYIGIVVRKSALDCIVDQGVDTFGNGAGQLLLPHSAWHNLAPGKWQVPLLAVPARIRTQVEMMRRTRVDPQLFRGAAAETEPLPPLRPYRRCACGSCRECRDNEKWDRVFTKFATKEYGQVRGMFRSPLSDL